MSSAPIIQVDCASCGTNYRLALPRVLVERPHKSMSFRCNHCSYKFQIQPKNILEQEAVASTLILVESNGFHVHHNLESVADLIENGTYAAEDTIRVFGQAWSMMGDEPSLASLFKGEEQVNEEQAFDENVEEQAFEEPPSEMGEEPDEEDVNTSDVPLHFDEYANSDDPNRVEADSEQDFSEIDPFSEGYSTAIEDNESTEILEDSLDADFFADAFDQLEEQEDVFDTGPDDDLGNDLGNNLGDDDLSNDDFDDLVIEDVDLDEDVFENVESEPFEAEDTPETTADLGQNIMEDFADDVTQVISTPEGVEEPSAQDLNEPLEAFEAENRDSALLTGFDDDDFEDIDNEFAVQAIEANLWEELEDSEEDEVPLAASPEPAPVAEDEPQSVQSTKSALLADSEFIDQTKSNVDDMQIEASPSAMVPEMEVDDDVSDSKSQALPSQAKIEKPKQRLSFSNKVPEVKKVKKREVNGLHAFALIVLFCIVVIAGTLLKINRDKQEFAGIETNSDRLKPMTTEKEGLRENDNEKGQAPDSENAEEGTELASLDSEEQGSADEAIDAGQFVDPFPQVLPDVPEESVDFANDKSSRELTREGYRALKEGNPDLAIKLFELALEKDTGFAEAVMGLGKSYQERGELEQAKDAYCRHANLPPESFSQSTMVEDVSISQGIVSQLGLTCDDA